MLLAALMAAILAAAPAPGEAKSALSGVLERADRYYEAKNFPAAWLEYRKVLFAAPAHAKAAKRDQEIVRVLAEELVQKGDGLWDRDPIAAVEHYHAAEKLHPHGKAVKAAFQKHGYKLHQGKWRTAQQIEAGKAQEQKRAKARMERLGLPASLKVNRVGVFRFFSDADETSPQLRHMMAAIQTHYAEYQRLMQPIGLTEPEDGLDVVLFRKREDYVRHTKSTETAGVYLPRLGASYYFLTGAGEDFATLLHEMTHQLDHKVTDTLGGVAPCFEEGMAEYFGYGSLTNSGRKLVLGVPRGEYIHAIREALGSRKGSLIPFDRLLLDREDLDKNDLFYPQSWALVHYLMHGHPEGRLILFDVLIAGKYATGPAGEEGEAMEAEEDCETDSEETEDVDEEDDGEEEGDPPPGSASGPPALGAGPPFKLRQNFGEILAAYGLDLSKFELLFKEYYRNLK